MDRRTFVSAISMGLLAAPLAARAQKAPTARVGWLAPEFKSFALDPFRQALKELGWVEGGSLAIEQRYARGSAERYPELAADLVRLKPDVLVTDGSPATRAAQQATATIPIVFVVGDPVAQGFVASLSRPGRNLTGMSIITGDLNPKRIQLLREAVPVMARLAVLQDQSAIGPAVGASWQAIEAASQQLGIQLTAASSARRADELDGAFALAVKERAGGVLVLPSALFSSQTRRIVSLAAKTRLPAIYEHRDFVEAGGLMSYGPSHRDVFRGIAVYVDKILKGAKAADLPVEQPTKLELAINLKTAKTLGLTIPQSLAGRADHVIE
ncbi:MAG TPA: ABC transporter substrate-binding protein [Methylomirabilota bacterium]|nr:ABC transporter substrate-binding protein [Methylomirabilota bacterium]